MEEATVCPIEGRNGKDKRIGTFCSWVPKATPNLMGRVQASVGQELGERKA